MSSEMRLQVQGMMSPESDPDEVLNVLTLVLKEYCLLSEVVTQLCPWICCLALTNTLLLF